MMVFHLPVFPPSVHTSPELRGCVLMFHVSSPVINFSCNSSVSLGFEEKTQDCSAVKIKNLTN